MTEKGIMTELTYVLIFFCH